MMQRRKFLELSAGLDKESRDGSTDSPRNAARMTDEYRRKTSLSVSESNYHFKEPETNREQG